MTDINYIEKILIVDYPQYEHISLYLAKILQVMGYMKGDDYQIVIENPEEPTRVSVSLQISYTS